MERVEFGGWKHCVRLANAEVELIVTTDVGPRIARVGFIGGDNLMAEFPKQQGLTGGDQWRLYGGHRLWHAPEAIPRTYFPDNDPVDFKWDADRNELTLTPQPETTCGMQKQIAISLEPDRNVARVAHRITNIGLWSVSFSPWALSVMAPNGRVIVPQEDFIPHSEHLLPARPLVLWHYLDMSDPRYTWGRKYVQLRQDTAAKTNTKFGVRNTKGWAAYTLNDTLFVKRFGFDPAAEYPDFGCNAEFYTDHTFIEVESLGPFRAVEPGETVEHVEIWGLKRATVGDDDDAIDAVALPFAHELPAPK